VIILLVLLLSIPVYGYCIDPKDKKTIFSSTDFCSQSYQLRNGIKIGQDGIVIDCGGAIIQGLFQGETGILIENRNKVTIKNCMIMNYDVGIGLVNSTNVTVSNVALIRNQIGLRLEKSNNNTFIKNRDISLRKPVKEIESFENVFQYENKNIKGDFCRYNTCNELQKIKRITPVIKGEYSLKEILMEAIELWINTD
jgi:hypothetical protein